MIKLSYYQFLTEDVEYNRAKMWEQYGPAIKRRLRNPEDLIIPNRVMETLNHINENPMDYSPRTVQDARVRSTSAWRKLIDMPLPEPLVEKHYQEIKDKIQSSVPHPKYEKKIAEWLANGSLVRKEDIEGIGEEFGTYHNLASRKKLRGDMTLLITRQQKNGTHLPVPVAHTDFHKFDISALFRVLGNKIYQPSNEEKIAAANQRIADLPEGSHTIVHDDEHVTVIHPHTHEAAIAFSYAPDCGDKARWCTAIPKRPATFEDYNKDGPLLIFRPKNPEHEGEMYQYHKESDQLMDEEDQPVWLDDEESEHHPFQRMYKAFVAADKYSKKLYLGKKARSFFNWSTNQNE